MLIKGVGAVMLEISGEGRSKSEHGRVRVISLAFLLHGTDINGSC